MILRCKPKNDITPPIWSQSSALWRQTATVPYRTHRDSSNMKESPNVKFNCAYLLGGRVPHFEGTYALHNPRVEFQEFMERNVTKAYDFSALDLIKPSFLSKQLKPKVQFALRCGRWRSSSNVSIASGEDIGILCALYDVITQSKNPMVIITHGSYFGSKYWGQISRVLRTKTHIHWACLSNALAVSMVSDYGFAPDCVHSSGYGVDTEYFQPVAAFPTKPLILSAGTANRDYKTLVSAVQGVNVDVRIAADSAWYPVETNLREVSLPSNITVKSAGNYTGLRDLYAACHFVVVPMLPARFACGYAVIAEAMAMGKTVIATRTHSNSDFIKDGVNGFLVDVGDVDTLRARINYLLENPSVVARMGHLARTEMEGNWSLPAYTVRLEAAVKAASGLFSTSH